MTVLTEKEPKLGTCLLDGTGYSAQQFRFDKISNQITEPYR